MIVRLRGIAMAEEKCNVSDPLAIKLGDITMVSPGELLKMASRREPGPESAREVITVGWASAVKKAPAKSRKIITRIRKKTSLG
jgi:hypothetical protein